MTKQQLNAWREYWLGYFATAAMNGVLLALVDRENILKVYLSDTITNDLAAYSFKLSEAMLAEFEARLKAKAL